MLEQSVSRAGQPKTFGTSVGPGASEKIGSYAEGGGVQDPGIPEEKAIEGMAKKFISREAYCARVRATRSLESGFSRGEVPLISVIAAVHADTV